MDIILRHKPFIFSVFSGILIWLAIIIFLPVCSKYDFNNKTLAYVFINYLSLFIGYFFLPRIKVRKEKLKKSLDLKVKILILLIIFSFIFRWVDLFYFRELSFVNPYKVNRGLNNLNSNGSSIIFLIASILKGLYFSPFIILLSIYKQEKKNLFVLSCFLLLLPFVEAILFGSRKPFLEVFFIILVALFYYKKIKLDKKSVAVFLVSIFILFGISMSILLKRENRHETNDVFFEKIIQAKYNDLLMPNDKVKNYIKNNSNSEFAKFLLVSSLHIGQYFTHGLFEFNHILSKENIPYKYGSYTFFVLPKFLNKVGLSNKTNNNIPSIRNKVYLTAFGGLYLDFKWMSVPFFFLFGALQKYTFIKSKNSPFWTPLLIYLFIINVFLLSINYIRGSGSYPIISLLIILFFMRILDRYLK